MEHFPAVHSREESDALALHFQSIIDQHGWGPWAVEIAESGRFIGYVGLSEPRFDTSAFSNGRRVVEIAWRLARDAWGHGYATEAARAACAYGFDRIGLEEIVSFTVPANVRSRRVMERLGMTRSAEEDFDHPALPAEHPLRRHVLYRLARSAFARPTTAT